MRHCRVASAAVAKVHHDFCIGEQIFDLVESLVVLLGPLELTIFLGEIVQLAGRYY